jgi:polysaccharide biosynthesis protein PslH
VILSAKKKLVYFTSRFPFPLTKGDRLRAYYQIRELSKTYDIYLICTNETKVSEREKEELSSFCKEIHVFKLKRWKIYASLAVNVLSSNPFQVAYFHQLAIQRKVDQLLTQIQPDHILAQLLRSSEYVKNYHQCSKTIDYMDALSKGMERRYETGNPIYRFLFKMEFKRLKEYERKIFDYFENQIIITKQDKGFIFHPDYRKIEVIPNGIDISFFESQNVPKTNDIVFIGNLSYEPNIQATEFLYKHVHKAYPNLKIQISGANPEKRVSKLAEENFKITGFVEDIRQAYSSGKIFVAPMFIGTGLQNKLLEAMAQGIPCITTSLVNNALGAKVGEEILVADSEREFMIAIPNLLSDEVLYQKLQSNAKRFVHEKYSWNSINEKLIDVIESKKIDNLK